MANIKSAKKRISVTARKHERNVVIKSKLKTAIKKFETAVNDTNLELAQQELLQATKTLDKAVSKGIIHKNLAARKKSRLANRLNKLAQA
ncbi:30S ribosomal protein S20 [Desulfuribacillus alkaliarsenatis]|uniref:Small ribosomal subunit protein bS20 n=1 Tax=Desulfuribacillus alkaliarsenatis TaxID=766136 RepID=A0A1E5G087_9FIRM|nr:30S ribosomal protein S20 [Desulfuribacillus alkaliarsenatis]OEF96247.1 30S ribosomal protein S20 [Desulfuribacillus alkaliarsenatis]